jgi:flagellar operon protein
MTDKVTIGQMYVNGLSPSPIRKTPITGNQQDGAKTAFQNILQQQFVKFSHHAEMRLQERGIRFMPDQMAKLESAIDKAATKGAKDTLMLLNGTALIVNVPNRTVITAVDGTSMRDNVFTQIDSAVIIT